MGRLEEKDSTSMSERRSVLKTFEMTYYLGGGETSGLHFGPNSDKEKARSFTTEKELAEALINTLRKGGTNKIFHVWKADVEIESKEIGPNADHSVIR